MKRFLFLLLLYPLLYPSILWAAVANDNAQTVTGNSVSPLTISNFVITGSDTLLLCGSISVFKATTDVQFNGVSLTPIGIISNAGIELTMWALAGVSGTHDVDFYYEDSFAGKAVAGCVSKTGVDQVTPVGSTSTTTDWSGAPVNMTVPTDGQSWDFAAAYGAIPGCYDETASGGTEDFDACYDGGAANSTEGFSSTRTTSGTHGWDSPSGEYQFQIGVPINPATVIPVVIRHRVINQ